MERPIRSALKDISRGNDSGLTLLEVVVALSICAVLLGILSQFLYSGATLWAKNDRVYQRQHRLKYIYQLSCQDISFLFHGRYLPEKAVRGDEYQLAFWKVEPDGLVQVKYRYDRTDAKVYRSSGFWGSNPTEAVALEGISDWQFEYYDPVSQNWLLEWESEQDEEIPSLIRIKVKTAADGDLGVLVIPVKAWHKEVEDTHE